MLILDLDYLDSVPEITSSHLHGGKNALAFSNFWIYALGDSTFVGAVTNNQAITDKAASFSSSSVEVIATSSGGFSAASVSSHASASR